MYRIISDDISRGEMMLRLQSEKGKAFGNGTQYERGIVKGLEIALEAVCEARVTGVWTTPDIHPQKGFKVLLKLRTGEYENRCTCVYSEKDECWRCCETGMREIPEGYVVGWRMLPE